MRRIVLGTAGHIDHGKTSLVRALTGTDTDRLKEERARGITIELGFTHLALPDGNEAGFVDVPGHEKFVRTMIAGAAGIDLVLLVLAADEGVMPQTREHLDICGLLGVRDGLVVLNKIDTVDPEMADLAREEAAEAMIGTFLEGRPIVPFSAKTGAGKEELLREIATAAARIQDRSAQGPFRMPVDRVFTMKGFGTVTTGTSIGGRVKIGDTLEVHPGGATGRVRGLQVHGRDAGEALAGSRTAINLQGLDREQVPRGSVLSTSGALRPSHIVDVEYHHLPGAPERFRPKRVRFLCGTQEVIGNLTLFDAAVPEPGRTHLAQMRLESPVAVRSGDRFVLRTYSPMTTVGGGRIIDNRAKKRKAEEAGAADHLASLASDDSIQRVEALVRDGGSMGVTLADLASRLPPGESGEAASIARGLAKAGTLDVLDGPVPRALGRESFDRLAGALIEAVTRFHRAEPSRPGIPRGVLFGEAFRVARVGGPDAVPMGEAVLRKLEAAKKLATIGGEVKLPSHTPTLDPATSDLKPVVEGAYRETALTPPTLKEIGETHGPRAREVQSVIGLLHREGILVKVSQDLYFHREAISAIEEKLVEYLKAKERITTLEFKELAGNLTRKFMIPLLEHFDTTRVTMRVGEERVLRKKG